MSLDCRSVGLNHVPDTIPDDVVDIDLNSNNIIQLHSDSFLNCINVLKLDFSANHQISVIRNSMLRSMPKLEVIAMADINIAYNVSSFPDDTFSGLLHLRSVSLQRNNFKYYDTSSATDFAFMMRKLPNRLEELNVAVPLYRGFLQPLVNFTHLTKLGIYDHAFGSGIHEETFKYLENSSLESLTIRSDDLSGVHRLAFYHLTGLKQLDVRKVITSGLITMTILDFKKAFIGLQNTKLEKLKISNFWPKSPHKIIMQRDFCEGLVLPHLTDLQMDHDQLYGINVRESNKSCFSGLQSLKRLNLSFNYLTFTSPDFILFADLIWISTPFELDISQQVEISQYIVSNKGDGLLELELSSMLTKLDMSCIMNSDNNLPVTLVIDSITRLRYLNFQGNFVRVLKNISVTKYTTSVALEADFSRNNMISFAGSFDYATQKYGLKVVGLFLSENRLGGELGKEETQVFKYLKDLEKLDLSSNDIKTLPPPIFNNLDKLKYLHLNKNSLSLVLFKIARMRNLLFLDLSDNVLSQFDENLQSDIDSLNLVHQTSR